MTVARWAESGGCIEKELLRGIVNPLGSRGCEFKWWCFLSARAPVGWRREAGPAGH